MYKKFWKHVSFTKEKNYLYKKICSTKKEVPIEVDKGDSFKIWQQNLSNFFLQLALLILSPWAKISDNWPIRRQGETILKIAAARSAGYWK